MHKADASAFTSVTCGAIRPRRCATAYITSGTPWPLASGANLCTIGPYTAPATTGVSNRNQKSSAGQCALATRPSPE